MVVTMAAALMALGTWVIESFSNVTDVAVVLEFVAPMLSFVEVFSDVLVEAIAVGITVEVLADVNVNVLAAVMTALEFFMSIS